MKIGNDDVVLLFCLLFILWVQVEGGGRRQISAGSPLPPLPHPEGIELSCGNWLVSPGNWLMSDLGNYSSRHRQAYTLSQAAPRRRHIVASRPSSPIQCHKPPLVADTLSQAAPRRWHIVSSRPLVADTLSQAAPRRWHIVASRPSSLTNCQKPPLVANQKIIVADYISCKKRFENHSLLKT
jgi:hypothetical protein